MDPVLSTWDGRRDRVHFGARLNESIGWYVEEKRAHRDPRLTECDDLLAIARGEEVAQITTFARDDEGGPLAERIGLALSAETTVHASPNFYLPGWTEITVQHSGADKGAAVPALLAACEAADAEVIACGDHLNDLALFAAAASSVAPANAHPAVLEAATEVVAPNDEDGIVRYLLERHLPSEQCGRKLL